MRIASLHLDNNIILAPMAGISDLPYRRLMKSHGAGLVFTEMVSANGLVRDGRRTRELLRSAAEERPLGVQLFGEDPDTLAEAARRVEEDGDLLDLNFGCPVNKVVRSGAGSAMLRDPRRLGRAVAAVRRVTSRPLTVKIRSGWDAGTVNFRETARVAVAEGADAVTLHPRTRAAGFGGKADWRQIAELKTALPVPVIGSGDVFSAGDAQRMLAETGCDGLMIGRGGYGNPWLLQQIAARLAGRPEPPAPAPGQRGATAEIHLDIFVATFGEKRALREMRKHLCWYSRGLPGAAAFRTAVNQSSGLSELRRLVRDFFAAAGRTHESARQ